jgi:hypothetical protein
VAAEKLRGVGVKIWQVSTPIYRRSPRVRVLIGPNGLEWTWPKTLNCVALNYFRNKNVPADFVSTENRAK